MKNTLITLIFSLLASLNLNAQEKKINLGVSLFPSYSMDIVSNTVNSPFSNELETWKPSISGNFFVEYAFSETSFLSLGLGYQNHGARTKKSTPIFGFDPTTGLPIPNPSGPSEVRFAYNHHNLEVPLLFRQMISRRFYVIGGVSGIINFSNTTTAVEYYTENPTSRTREKDISGDFRVFNVFANLGVGLDYYNTENLSLFVHPYAQYGILKLSKSGSINRNAISLGISTGIRI